MIKRTYISRFHYGQEDIAELEIASVHIFRILKKTRRMLSQFVPEPFWLAVTGTSPDPVEDMNLIGDDIRMFQIWAKTLSGWKFIGYETENLDSAVGWSKRRGERLLQMIVWSLYEKIVMLHPFLGCDPLYDGDELDVIAKYMVPIYTSAAPLREQGKMLKTIHDGILLFQEHIQPPAVMLQAGGGWMEGNWMTGVNLDGEGFAGIRPYLKVPNGERAYMEAEII